MSKSNPNKQHKLDRLNEVADYYKKAAKRGVVTKEEADAATIRLQHDQDSPLSPELLDKADTAVAETLGDELNKSGADERYEVGSIRKSKSKKMKKD